MAEQTFTVGQWVRVKDDAGSPYKPGVRGVVCEIDPINQFGESVTARFDGGKKINFLPDELEAAPHQYDWQYPEDYEPSGFSADMAQGE